MKTMIVSTISRGRSWPSTSREESKSALDKALQPDQGCYDEIRGERTGLRSRGRRMKPNIRILSNFDYLISSKFG